MALTVKGSLAFGLTDPSVGGIGNPTSVSVTSENTVNSPARDAGGETVCRVFGDPKTSIRVEGYDGTAAIPSVGDAVTAHGKSGVVMRATVAASNQDFVRMSVEASGFDGVTYS